MDRERNSREGREVKRTSMAASNGLSRRRHRSNSLRDSPEDDDAMEYQETTRLRDRGISKKERDHRLSRNKRRRVDRFMHGTTNRDRVGDDTSDESLEDDEEEDDDDEPGPQRMPPPNPNPNPNPIPIPNPSSSSVTNHHRKSFPQVTKVVRAAPYEMGFSVPKKARSASAKRSHELISVAAAGGGVEQVHRQASTSPARPSVAASLPAPASPSSSSVSHKKKMKQMGHKLKPPKVSKSSSVQDEIEIEVAEVLYGLMRQSSRLEAVTTTSQKLESRDTNGSTTDARSRVSSPISFPPSSYPTQQSNLPQNPSSSTAPLSAVAPKRKRPRIVKYDDDSSAMFSARSGSISSTAGKVENEQKVGVSSPKLERVSGSTLENNGNGAAASDPVNSQAPALESSSEPPESAKKESNVNLDTKPLNNESEVRDVLQSKEIASSPKKDSSSCDKKMDVEPERATETKAISIASGVEKRREENLVIDLMAPPLRSSPERDEVVDLVSDAKSKVSDVEMKVEIDAKQEDNVNKTGEQEVVREAELAVKKKKTEPAVDECEPQKSFDRKQMGLDPQIDLEKHSKDKDPFTTSDNKAQQTQKQQQHQSKALQIESKSEKDVQSTSIPLPMAPAGWPGLLPNLGGAAQVRPLQGVLSLDGKSVASTAAQSPDFLLSRPRPKRCTTHYYIAQNIYQHQQYSKMMWSSGAGPTSLFGTTPPYNLNVMPPMETAIVGNPLQGSFAGRNLNPTLDKGQAEVVKDKSSVASNFMDPAQKKQLVVQHAPPQMHGPAFIFHLNQQQAAAVAGNKSGVTKSLTSGNPSSSSSAQSAPGNSSSIATAATTLSFNYQGLPANEGQYLAILQNSGYPFPVGAPPHYRGATPSQALPFLNGSFYPSQMLHPSQFQQQQHLQSQSQQQPGQQGHQNGSTSSGSSSSQKHQQNQQQRLHCGGSNAVGGNSNSFPGSKNRSSQPQNSSVPLNHQVRHLEADLVVEDSLSAEDMRKAAYNNFSMQAQQKNFSAMSAALVSGGTGNHGDKQHQPQQHNSKGGPELIPAQAFAMPFGPFNGAAAIPGFDMQNHVIFQNLPEAARHGYPQMAAAVAAAQASQQKRTHQYSEETKTVSDLNTADDEKKVVAGKGTFNVGQGLVFSRPDSADRSTNLGSGVIDSSAHTLNLISAPSNRTSRSNTSTGAAIAGAPAPNTSNSQQQQQQQQLIQLQKHQHQQLQQQQQQQLQQQQQIHHQQQQQLQHKLAAAAVARSKPSNTTSPNAHSDRLSPNAHSDRLSTSSMTGKLPNSLSGFPQTLVQGGSSAQSPQWKNSSRTSVSSGSSPGPVSNTSSLKNHHAQQQGRPQQGHTQISFGVNNPKQGSASHWQQIPTSNQSSSPPVVGSPQGSISKSSGGSPKTTSTGSKVGPAPPLSSQQQATKSSSSGPSRKSSPVGGMNMPSILGNSHVTSTPRSNSKAQSQQQQQQQQQKQLQQAQLYFANAFVQAQTPQSTTSATTMSNASTIGYYQQRRPSEQQQQGSSNASSGMISLSPSLTLAGVTTSDPTKAVAAAATNMKGGVLPQGLLHAPQFATQSGGHPFMSFPYIQSVPPAQVKPAEQKQPAGNDNLHACWQPEKR